MKIAIYSTSQYDREFLDRENLAYDHQLVFFEQALNLESADLASGCQAVSIFVNDDASAEVLQKLHQLKVGLLALRCAGYNHVDLDVAQSLKLAVVRVSEYSPYAVAEQAAMLLLALNRKLISAHERIQKRNFVLDGLMGVDLHGKTVGIIGAGRIGEAFCKIARGMGCQVIAYDIAQTESFIAAGGRYVTLNDVAKRSDVISLHCALTPETKHLINEDFISQCKTGVLIINTSRGAVIDTQAALDALQSGHLGGLAIDVYEFEAGLFFKDHSSTSISDPLLQKLQSMSNVIMTGHQGFLTQEAFETICRTTLASVTAFENGQPLENEISV
jgi:D-lactate dehydrogenase